MLPRVMRTVFGEVRRGETVLFIEGGGTLVVPTVLKGFKAGDPVDVYFAAGLTPEVKTARVEQWKKRARRT